MKWPVLLTGASLLVPPAVALAAPPSYRLEVSAPDACPPPSALRVEIARRGAELDFALDGKPISLDIAFDGSGTYTARLVLPGREPRRIEARRCEEVIEAAAFIIVVALEERRTEPTIGMESEIPGTAPAGGTRSAVSNPPARSVHAGVTVAARGALSPELMPTLGVFLSTRREQTWLALGGRAALFAGRSSADLAEGGSASFGFVGAEVDLCPAGLGPLLGCLGAEAGVLDVVTEGGLSVGHRQRFWSAGHVGALLSLALSRVWLAELQGGLTLPFTRDRFLVRRADGSDSPVHQPAISGYAAAAVGYRL